LASTPDNIEAWYRIDPKLKSEGFG